MEKRWLSPQEVSQEYSLHIQSVYKLFYKGKLPGGRIGGAIRIDKLKIDAALEGRGKKK